MKLVVLGFAIALAACGSKAAVPDAFFSTCGEPGDMGNTIGVGQFCEDLSMCPQTAPLCSYLGDHTTFFCTKTCHPPDAGVPDPCGANTTCECETSGSTCGCTPNTCLN